MALVWSTGYETGDFSQCGATAGTFSIDATTVASGLKSLKFPAQVSAAFVASKTGFNLPTAYYRFKIYLASNLGVAQFIAGMDDIGETHDIVLLQLGTSGLLSAVTDNGITTLGTGTIPLNLGAWNVVELKTVISAGSGIVEVKINGVVDQTYTGLMTNAFGNIDTAFVGVASGNSDVDIYFDDEYVDDTAYPGNGNNGRLVFGASTPTYNAWEKSTGSTIDTVWNDVPFNPATFARAFKNFDNQTAIPSTVLPITAGATITGVTLGLVAKTAFTTAPGITQVGATQSGSSTAGANVTLTFSVTPQAGDVALLFGGFGTAGANNPGPSTAGYTPLYTLNTTATRRFGIWAKVMGTTPDTTVVGLGSGTAGDGVAYAAVVLRQVSNFAILDIAVPAAAIGSSTNPNPPAAGASVTANDFIYAVAASAVSDAAIGTQASFTQDANPNAAATRPFSLGLSHLTTPPAAGVNTDPPAWSAWATGAWVAQTISIRPAALAGSAVSGILRWGGVDRNFPLFAIGTSDGYQQFIQTSPLPTAADLVASEWGVGHDDNSALITVEDVFALIDYIPAFSFMDAGMQLRRM